MPQEARRKRRGLNLPSWTLIGAAAATLSVSATAASAQMPSQDLMQEDVPTLPHVERHRDWLLTCQEPDEERACQFAPASAETSGEAQVGLAIVSAPEDDGLVAIFRAPLGVLLSAGITLRIDDREIGQLAFQTCEADGCVAPARLEGALASGMRRGAVLEAELVKRDGATSRTRFSLMGVTSGLQAMRDRALND